MCECQIDIYILYYISLHDSFTLIFDPTFTLTPDHPNQTINVWSILLIKHINSWVFIHVDI